MKAAILVIGDEIISGHTVDTNSNYLANALNELGVSVVEIVSVGDRVEEIASELKALLEKADIILTSGGLGSTHDDVTKQAIAEALSRRLVLEESVIERITRRVDPHRMPKRWMLESIATLPEGSIVFENPVGLAPGVGVIEGEKIIYLLPGVPSELKAIFESSVIDHIARRASGKMLRRRVLRTAGLAESEVSEALKDWLESTTVRVGILPEISGVTLRLTAIDNEPERAERILDEATEKVLGLLGDAVYSTEGKTIEAVVGEMLIQRNLKVAVAESCTGGLVGHLLTEIPGISACLDRVLVTYSNSAKVDLLGVPEELIAAFGAVSAEVARAMACGVRERSRVDIGVSTTGIAGPSGGSESKPVGLVYMAVTNGERVIVEKRIFRGMRSAVKMRAAYHTLNMLRLFLLRG